MPEELKIELFGKSGYTPFRLILHRVQILQICPVDKNIMYLT